MKKIISVICSSAIAIASLTFSGASVIAEDKHHDNVLIAYFSRAGENYSVGVIEKGNTELFAEIVAEETGGDLFKIEHQGMRNVRMLLHKSVMTMPVRRSKTKLRTSTAMM